MKRLALLSIMVAFCGSATAQNRGSATPDGSDFLAKVSTGNVYFQDGQVSVDELPWNPHPKFKGVYLKNLISGEDTDRRLSCHIVKIEPFCTLDMHAHDGQIEIHEVVAGDGKFCLDGKDIRYSVGTIAVIPADTPHKVVAGKDGLYLFAKFTPAL